MANIDGTINSDDLIGTGHGDTISGADSGDLISGRGGNDVLYGFGTVDTNADSGAIDVERIVTGLDGALAAVSPPGQPGKLYIAQQFTGEIQIVDLATNTVSSTPFLDIPQNELSTGGEQGLLGVAFDPNYEHNGKFYVDITNADGDTEIWRYKRSDGDPEVADPASKKLIIRIDQPFENHNGGWIDFGPDGNLYIAMGDGGSGGDPQENAQNIDSLLGKMLRLDVHGDDFASDQKNYAIPDGNPFVGVDGADEVWAYGLRNPWRNSFDSATGDLYIADVGQDAHEEVNFVAAGEGAGFNFGWDVREGDFPFEGPDDPSFVDPIIDIPHNGGDFGGSTVIGGYVYHGPGGGDGLYFFSDAGSNNFWTTRVVDGEATQYVNIGDYLRGDVGSLDSIVSWGVDGTDRLYAVGLDGEIFRFTPSAAAGDAGDTMKGGDGNDEIWGGAGDDSLNGGADDDALNGGLGSDTASYAGADAGVVVDLSAAGAQVTGGAGTDTLDSIENLRGSKNGDSLTGDSGDNVLGGANGDDTLRGGEGADAITGGRGGDTMRGDGGNDTFIYLSVLESHGHSADQITNLENSDTIDLSAIDADIDQSGNQHFSQVDHFSGEAGELVVVFDGTNTRVKGDVNGDGDADLVLVLTGNHETFDNFDL